MSDTARSKHFQLYIVFQPNWDEAMPFRSTLISNQKEYLDQFIDPIYVHMVFNDSLTFKKTQFQNTEHLRQGSGSVYTEDIVGQIAAIQNSLTPQANSLVLKSVAVDKESYYPSDKPIITLEVTTKDGKDIKCYAAGLLRTAAVRDGDWVLRTQPGELIVSNNYIIKTKLTMDVSLWDKPDYFISGTYDLVVFLRQDFGNLSHETRFEYPGLIKVRSTSADGKKP